MALTHWASEGDANTHLDKGQWTGGKEEEEERRECNSDDVLQGGRYEEGGEAQPREEGEEVTSCFVLFVIIPLEGNSTLAVAV